MMLELLLVVVGAALGQTSGAVIALIFAAGLNFAMYFYSDKLALRASKAVPVSDVPAATEPEE